MSVPVSGSAVMLRGADAVSWGVCTGHTWCDCRLSRAAQVTSNQAYAFYEYATDLGSSRLCRGNPTEYFRRAGAGGSLGAGLKLGAVRLEYATDRNAGKGTVFVRFGERF